MLEDGNLDEFALHGGCPVKEGEKWGANWWYVRRGSRQHHATPRTPGGGTPVASCGKRQQLFVHVPISWLHAKVKSVQTES